MCPHAYRQTLFKRCTIYTVDHLQCQYFIPITDVVSLCQGIPLDIDTGNDYGSIQYEWRVRKLGDMCRHECPRQQSWVNGDWCFWISLLLHIQGVLSALSSCSMDVAFQQTYTETTVLICASSYVLNYFNVAQLFQWGSRVTPWTCQNNYYMLLDAV